MRRSMSRASIRSLTDTFCRYKGLEKVQGRKNVSERTEFYQTFVALEGLSKFKFGAKSVPGSLQSQIVNALHLGERDKAFNFLSILSRGNEPLRSDDFVYILDYCARSPDPLFVMETWRIMEEKQIDMNTKCHRLIMEALTKGGYLEEALNWLSFLGQSPQSFPDLSMYNTFLKGCVQMESMVHVDSCLDLMENQMVGKSEATYVQLLKVAVLQKNLSAVHEIWKQFTKYYSPNIISLQKIINCFTSLGDLVSACEALQHAVALVFHAKTFVRRSVQRKFRSSRLDIPIPSTNDFAFKRSSMSTTVGGLTRTTEVDLIENHKDVFNATNEALYDSVNCPNGTSVEEGRSGECFALFPMANQGNCFAVSSRELQNGSSDVPNRCIETVPAMSSMHKITSSQFHKKILRWSFDDVIHACAQARNCELAEQLFLQMQKIGLEPSSQTYDGLIKAVVYERGVTNGLKMLKAMEEANLEPRYSTLGTLSIACSQHLELELAEVLVDQIVKTSWRWPFNALLAAYDAMDQPERAVRLLAKMKQLKLKSDTRTYELLFSLFGNVNAPYEKGNIMSQVDAAKRINAIEMDMMKNGVQHSYLSVANLLRALGAEGMVRELTQYLRVAENQIFLANPFQGTAIYNSALHSLVEAKESHMAIELFKDMKLRDLPPDTATYNIMIDCCGVLRCFKSACVFVSMMLREGFFPQTCTYTTLIKILLENDSFDEALHLLYQVSLEGIQPDVVLFNTILHKANRKGRIDIIEFIVERMHQERIQPDPDTCTLVFRAYLRHGFLSTALEALQVLSMRMISEEEGVLQENRTYFEDNFIFSEDSQFELRIIKIFNDSNEYLATALWNLRWCAVVGLSISWSPNQSEWAKQLSCSYDCKS